MTVSVDESWHELDMNDMPGRVPDPGYWDTIFQDTETIDDPAMGVRFIAGTQWGSADAQQPVGDPERTLQYLTLVDPFQMAAHPLPDPVQVRDGDVEVWRQDIDVAGEDDLQYHFWAATHTATETTVVVGLGGPGVTPEMAEHIDESLDVSPPAH